MAPASTSTLRLACGISGHPQVSTAAEQVCEQCTAALGDTATDLALLFFSGHHAEAAPYLAEMVHKRLTPRCILGVSAESVLGGQLELERAPGVSLLVGQFPGVELYPFTGESLAPVDPAPEAQQRLGAAIGVAPDLRATILFADPFSVPMIKLLPAMNKAIARARPPAADGDDTPPPCLVGGLASSARQPGGNRLILNGKVYTAGAVGVSIRGPVRVDSIVSQGCRPFGPNLVITKSRGNIIMQLGGRPALEAVHDVVGEMPEADRQKLEAGLFVGRVINEYKERFGRGDFLIRNVTGVEQKSGALAVNDLFKVGQTVRLHFRDAATASEDLALLMDAQQLRERPAGALLITCNGRGTKLFPVPNHDAAAVVRAFAPPEGGEQLSKFGEAIRPPTQGQPHPLPLAGFFAGGEIGPVGKESFLHGHSACVVMFRQE